MSEDRIKRKNLWVSLNNIKTPQEWLKASEKLGLRTTRSTSGTSHCTIRDPKNLDNNDPKSLIATIQKNLYKQSNQRIFKQIIDFGIGEDDLWKALGMM